MSSPLIQIYCNFYWLKIARDNEQQWLNLLYKKLYIFWNEDDVIKLITPIIFCNTISLLWSPVMGALSLAESLDKMFLWTFFSVGLIVEGKAGTHPRVYIRLFQPLNSLVVTRNLWLILWSKIWKFSNSVKHSSKICKISKIWNMCLFFLYSFSGWWVISNFVIFH